MVKRKALYDHSQRRREHRTLSSPLAEWQHVEFSGDLVAKCDFFRSIPMPGEEFRPELVQPIAQQPYQGQTYENDRSTVRNAEATHKEHKLLTEQIGRYRGLQTDRRRSIFPYHHPEQSYP